MEAFEAELAKATDPATRDLLGAVVMVIDENGKKVYATTSIENLTTRWDKDPN